ncbi:MAG: hypothetical protein ACI8ZX_002218, partial [Planctomycetota bacterium]
VNTKTGEIYYICTKKYLNLTFTFNIDSQEKLQKLIVRGSIHYFFNKGIHNANIFTFNNFIKSLNSYSSLFGLDLKKCILLPIEYGTNLYLNEFCDFNVNEIILNIHCVKRKMFNCNQGYQTSKISGTSNHEVRIKVYSKSQEYFEYCKNTIRLEDKRTKSRRIVKEKIIYVSDLYLKKNHLILLDIHLENISKIVLFDFTMKIPKNSKYSKLINKYSNPIYWQQLINDCKKGKIYDNNYNYEVSVLNSLSKRYGSDILRTLLKQIEKQTLKSLNLCNYNRLEIIKNSKNARKVNSKNARLYIGNIPSINIISYNRDIKDQFVKECEVTGLDISMQKEDSSTLSSTGLKYYYKIDIEVFLRIKKEYLSINWVDSDFQKQIEEIAHNIRNYKGNKKRKEENLYSKEQLTLFDILPNCRYIN